MNDLDDTKLIDRLGSLPNVGTPAQPDTSGMRTRAAQRRARKRIAGSVIAFGVVAGGTLGAISAFGGSSPQVIQAASGTETTLASSESLPENDGGLDAEPAPSTTTTPPETEEGGIDGEPAPTTTAPADLDDATEEPEATTTTPATIAIGPGEVSDQLGGKLVVGEDEILHVRADGTIASVVGSRFDGAAQTQFWLTDLAPLNGVPHLFFNTFTAFDFDQSIFETTIETVNLETNEVTVVERRRIEGTNNDNWIYNDHVTTDGVNILVARSLWQGQCYFTETLTPAGELLDVDEVIPKPDWIEGIDPATAEEWQVNWELIPDCVDLDEWNAAGEGEAVLGVFADSGQLQELGQAVN